MSVTKSIRALGEAMQRWWSDVVLSVAVSHSAIASSGAIDMRRYAGGWVEVPASLSSTSLAWYGCDEEDGTFLPIYYNGAAVTTTLPGGTACIVEIPAACWSQYFVKALANSDSDTIRVGRKT